MLYRASLLGTIVGLLAMSSAAAQSAADSAIDIELRLRRAANAMVAAEEERISLEKRLAAERSRVVETEVERDLNRDTILRFERDLSSANAREGEVRKILEALQSERRALQHGARPATAPPRSVDYGAEYYRSVVSWVGALPAWLWPVIGLALAGAFGAIMHARRRRLLGAFPSDPADNLLRRGPTRARWIMVGGSALLTLAIGIGSLAWLVDHLERTREEAERLRMAPLLEQAGHDDSLLRDLRQSCNSPCPPDILGIIDGRLRVNENESAVVKEAQDSIEKLRQYVRDCKACTFKADAVARIDQLMREARAREIVRFEQSFVSAGQDELLLRRFMDACKEPCPESLRIRAQTRLDEIRQAREQHQRRLYEQDLYRDARGNLARLRSYVTVCTVCAYNADARSEIADLEREETRMREAQTYRSARGSLSALNGYISNCSVCEFRTAAREEAAKLTREANFFRLKICNRTKQNINVAAAGRRDPEATQFRIEGWWIIKAGACDWIGNWAKGKIYTHAYTANNNWGRGGPRYCIARTVYDRVNSANYNCQGNEDLREFSEWTVNESDYTINFDP